MQLTTIIDVALGLILLYLVLSLICTTINELLAALLKLRARNLASTIRKLIDDETFRSAFYSHGLIISSALSSRAGGTRVDAGAAAADDADKLARPTYLDGKTVARVLIDSLSLLDPARPDVVQTNVETLIKSLPADSTIRKVMLANLAVANKDIDLLRELTANWFDSAMDRLSGSYNRQLKVISLAVGIGLAAALNADSLTIARAIWTDDGLKSQVEAASQKFVAGQNGDLTAPCAPASAASTSSSSEPADQAICAAAKLVGLEQQLRPFPLGWPDGNWPKDNAEIWWWALLKGLGIVWTGIALSLGAPFWFDLLQKFMSLRAAGGKPASSTDPGPGPNRKLEMIADPQLSDNRSEDLKAKTKPG